MIVLADGNGGTLTKYINGNGIDNKLKMATSGTAKYFLADHLGSTVGLTDASGNLTSSASYDSFGNSTGNLNTRYQYTGREFDNFTGLQYSRARWYDTNLGRFISEDPIGFRGGDVNLYGYVRNNSINRIDPSGLQDIDVIILNSPPYKRVPPTSDLGAIDIGGQFESRNFPRTFLPGDPYVDPYKGGYRHCVSACVLQKRYGVGGRIGVFFWDIYHENLFNNPSADNPSDMKAEQDGIACASNSYGDEDVCETECLKAYPKY